MFMRRKEPKVTGATSWGRELEKAMELDKAKQAAKEEVRQVELLQARIDRMTAAALQALLTSAQARATYCGVENPSPELIASVAAMHGALAVKLVDRVDLDDEDED